MTKINKQAIDIGQLAQKLAQGFYAYSAAMAVANDERAINLAPIVEPGQIVPVGRVIHKAGGEHIYDFLFYLEWAKTEEIIIDELARIWFSGSLLRIGDLLAQHNYFDRAPELELIRHLRNGIAHGNRFRIDSIQSLKKFPAHRIHASMKHHLIRFEINEHLNGQEVLFNFMEPADLVSLLQSVGGYLMTIGNGETPQSEQL